MDCENCPYKKAIEMLNPHLMAIAEISTILQNGRDEKHACKSDECCKGSGATVNKRVPTDLGSTER